MVLNAAVQILGETEELKQKISNFKSGVCMLQEPGQWVLQQQLQKIYQKVLLMDLDYALEKKVEQDLWNIGFKQQIEALQAITKDRKNAQRSEGQAMLACVLQAAAGFYLCLLHQICTTFKLDLPFRRRASLLGLVEGWGAAAGVGPAQPARRPPAAAVRYATQHCLVHLGDLARYRQQLAVACSFYRHALMVSAHSGQPYNQLALVWTRRGRRLSALYWHVRSLLVRAPFPPAASNLQRALNATASECLPVVPGVSRGQSGGGGGGTGAGGGGRATSPAARRLDSPALVDELLRVLRDIYNHDELENAERAVATLNTSLSALIATDSLDTSTLIKMACLIIWLVEWATEKYTLESDAMSEAEVKAVKLSYDLAAGVILAHLLPTYTADEPHENALPSLKVWLSWLTCAAGALRHESWGARGALWAALAHTLACLAPLAPIAPLADTADCQDYKRYETLPLPEDIELHGFLPIEGALSGIRFPDQVTWDTYGDRIPEPSDDSETDLDSVRCPLDSLTLSEQPTLARAARARRLLALGQNIADQRPDLLTYTIEDGKLKFTSPCPCGEPLPAAMLELSPPSPPPPPPPLVISEADFREKVREKRVGILKPQGSLERAREERLAGQHSEQAPAAEAEAEEGRGEEARREKKTRMNVAMAAIMRKQEETNKQVKFVTPPATPDSTSEVADAPPKDNGDKPKLVEPKPTKSLANIPVGRKTGGILSLKDKSAGYPHLVNAEPEPKPKPKEEKENKPAPKSQEHAPAGKWPYGETHRHAYGPQGGAPGYTGHGGPGIRLPVVNPKEIDVRSAALLKQSGRMELDPRPAPLDPRDPRPAPPDPRDRRALFADLPPRFANQYRYWHSSQDNHYHTHENKFRDDNFNQQNSALFGNQPRNWAVNPNPAQDVPPWYKPADNQNFSNPNFGQVMGVQGNFYSPLSSVSNPYRAPQYPAAPAPPAPPAPHAPNKPDGGFAHNFMQPPPLHNLMPSPNFNTLNFGSYTPAVTYDSAMYPQFNKMFPPPQLKAPEKQYGAGGGLHGGVGVAGGADTGFGGNVLDMQRNTLKYSEPPAASEAAKALEQSSGNTYSLFSARGAAWGPPPPPDHQSLWSGPGPSPLERLLEQQKQSRPPEPQ